MTSRHPFVHACLYEVVASRLHVYALPGRHRSEPPVLRGHAGAFKKVTAALEGVVGMGRTTSCALTGRARIEPDAQAPSLAQTLALAARVDRFTTCTPGSRCRDTRTCPAYNSLLDGASSVPVEAAIGWGLAAVVCPHPRGGKVQRP